MTFELNLDGVEAWKAGGLILRSGNHPIAVVDEEIRRPKSEGNDSDHYVVVLQMQAIGGEERDAEIRDWIHVTTAALGKIAQIYEAFKIEAPPGDFKWIPLKGRQAKVLVREEPKQNEPAKKVSKVKGYSPLSEVDAIAGAFDATEVGGGEPDIPF